MKQIDFDSMKLTDLQLEELRFDQTPEGKAARKEIHRRKRWDIVMAQLSNEDLMATEVQKLILMRRRLPNVCRSR